MTSAPALLLYDSARIASAMGLRSSLGADRTLIFRARGHTIDVMIQTSRRSPTYLHGQVVQEQTGLPVAGARVRLTGRDTTDTTDRHGEFAVSAKEPQSEHVLLFGVREGGFSCRIPAVPSGGAPA